MGIPYICMSTFLFITIAFLFAHYEVFCYFLYHHSTIYMSYVKKMALLISCISCNGKDLCHGWALLFFLQNS